MEFLEFEDEMSTGLLSAIDGARASRGHRFVDEDGFFTAILFFPADTSRNN